MHRISLDPTITWVCPTRSHFLSPSRLPISPSPNSCSISFSRVGSVSRSGSKTDPFRSLGTFHGQRREKTPPLIPEKKTHVRTETKVYGHSTVNGTEVVAMEESQEKEVIKEEEEKRRQAQLKWGLKEKVYSVVAAQFLLYTLATLAYAFGCKVPSVLHCHRKPHMLYFPA